MPTTHCFPFFPLLQLSSGEGGPGFPSGVVAAVVVIVILTFIAISLVGILVVCFKRQKATVKKEESWTLIIGLPLKMLYFNNCLLFINTASLVLCSANLNGQCEVN